MRPEDPIEGGESRSFENTDELFEQMQVDDLDGAKKLSPRDLAALLGTTPQLLYYHIRQKHIELETCQCGRRVLDVEATTEFWQSRKKGKASGIEDS